MVLTGHIAPDVPMLAAQIPDWGTAPLTLLVLALMMTQTMLIGHILAGVPMPAPAAVPMPAAPIPTVIIEH